MSVDVVIVGAGPAGSSAALALRAKGHTVTIVTSSRLRERPTETSTAAMPILLRSLGAEMAMTACEPCYGIASNWGRSASVLQPAILSPHGHAWFVHRNRFDAWLTRAAVDRGCILVEGVASNVEFNANGVTVATGNGTIMRAKWLVAATGSPVWPARITCQRPSTSDSLVAYWGIVPASNPERLLQLETTDSGWWYLCPADGPGAIACFVTDKESFENPDLLRAGRWHEMFRKTSLARNTAGASSATVHTTSIGVSELPIRHGPRWTAIGDSTVKLDPLGSSGILTAIDSGRRVALAVSGALSEDFVAMDRYVDWSTGLFREFLRQRKQQYGIEAKLHSSGFWARRLAADPAAYRS